MAEEDNFDIDIYGDLEESKQGSGGGSDLPSANTDGNKRNDSPIQVATAGSMEQERVLDPLATSALYVADLHWWTTEDEVRGWIREAGNEEYLKDITFSEHKVNGKSKGVAFIEFSDPVQASSAKAFIESIAVSSGTTKRHQVNFTSPNTNPFRTLPKDAPKGRNDTRHERPNQSGFALHSTSTYHPPVSSRGRGAFVAAAGRNMNMFTGGRGPVPVQLPHMSTPSQMATFQNTGFHQPQFGGGFPQHLPLRGGMANRMNRNASNAISGMMPGRGISQPDQFSMTPFNPVLNSASSFPATHFNPAFFTPGGTMPSQWDNPHGTKRPRPNE